MQDKKTFLTVFILTALLISGFAVYFWSGQFSGPKLGSLEEQTRGLEINNAREESGKISLIEETKIFVASSKKSVSSANISPSTVIVFEGSDRPGEFTDLKIGAAVVVKSDKKGNALEIIIKK